VLREDVVENAARDGRITERDDARLATSTCRLNRLPNCDIEAGRLVNHHQDVVAVKALDACRVVGRQPQGVAVGCERHLGLIRYRELNLGAA
jgi:hypothetical protein